MGAGANSTAVCIAGSALVACSLVGGIVSVTSSVNTWSNAWTADATLAAPWPMVVVQTAATWAATSRRQVLAVAGSAVLGLSAAVAGVSGFFDGQLGRPDLGTGYVAMQIVLVVVACATAVCAGLRLWKLRTRTEH
ncbi:MAG TPA: hypothetical protein VFP89_08875 [Propionibacteriaceae bacterium]|nr:hypothetical protein [Propionibacteriaceae bacterium]